MFLRWIQFHIFLTFMQITISKETFKRANDLVYKMGFQFSQTWQQGDVQLFFTRERLMTSG